MQCLSILVVLLLVPKTIIQLISNDNGQFSCRLGVRLEEKKTKEAALNDMYKYALRNVSSDWVKSQGCDCNFQKADIIRNVNFHWDILSFTWLKAHAMCGKKYTLTGEHVNMYCEIGKTIEILFKVNRQFNVHVISTPIEGW